MKRFIASLFCAALCFAAPAHASLYTADYGSQLAVLSDCDDCFSDAIAFTGTAQSINFFGTSYSGLYVSTNGYVTFGKGTSNYTSEALDTQTIAPMVAAYFTDLDSRGDATSNIYVNTTTSGEIVITWVEMGHFSYDYSTRSTFQIVVRSDQSVIAPGQGQIGIFYGTIVDNNQVSAGFGDGLAAANPGEVAFASFVQGSTLSNSTTQFFNVNNGVPATVGVPEPASIAMLSIGLAGLLGARRRKRA